VLDEEKEGVIWKVFRNGQGEGVRMEVGEDKRICIGARRKAPGIPVRGMHLAH
jgi:hypothetical protein